MNEKDFGEKLARLLQSSLSQIDDATAAKLKSVRLEALARYGDKTPATKLVLAGAGGGRFGRLSGPYSFIWAPLVAALLALGITAYWQYRQGDSDDIDAFVLSSDLPVQAYIDKDFEAWLKGSSR